MTPCRNNRETISKHKPTRPDGSSPADGCIVAAGEEPRAATGQQTAVATALAARTVTFEPLIARVGDVNLKNIHWAIVGGESGPRARPMDATWVDEIERQCRQESVAFFFKQWGGKNKKAAGRTYRGRVWDEFPLQLN